MAKSIEELITLLANNLSENDRKLAQLIVDQGLEKHYGPTGAKILKGVVSKQKGEDNAQTTV